MSPGRFLWRTFVATEAAKPGHAMTVQMTSQRPGVRRRLSPRGHSPGARPRDLVAVVLNGLERGPRDA